MPSLSPVLGAPYSPGVAMQLLLTSSYDGTPGPPRAQRLQTALLITITSSVMRKTTSWAQQALTKALPCNAGLGLRESMRSLVPRALTSSSGGVQCLSGDSSPTASL